MAVIVAVVSSVLAVVVHRQVDSHETATVPVGAANTTDLDLGRSGVVVTLSRPGFADLPFAAGAPGDVIVSVAAADDVVAVELLAGAEVVARAVPEDPTPTRTERLSWQPDAVGAVTLVARAYVADGRIGQSNPIRADVREAPPTVGLVEVRVAAGDTLAGLAERFGADVADIAAWNDLADADPLAPAAEGTTLVVPLPAPSSASTTSTPAASAAPVVHALRSPTTVGALPPLPADLPVAPSPSVTATVDGCTATVEAEAGAADQQLVLFDLPPSGGAFEPVGPIDSGGLELALTSGAHDLVVGATVDDSIVGWSGLFALPPLDDGCSGWSGDVRLVGSVLVADTQAEQAYLYLSTDDAGWQRVPAEGFVGRGPTGFDFAGLLPPLTGSSLRLEAWGRQGGSLVQIGSGRFVPPPQPSDTTAPAGGTLAGIADAVALPKAQLWWLRPSDWQHSGDPPKAVTSGTVPEPTTLTFQWSAPIVGVTHALVQVTSTHVPALAGPDPGGVLYQDHLVGNGGTFDIDFAQVVKKAQAIQNGTLAQVSSSGAQAYQAMAGALTGSTTTIPLASPHPIDLDPLDNPIDGPPTDEYLMDHFVVRVVPFVGDNWTGLTSNDVTLDVDPLGLYPVAPAGEKPYELEVELAAPPRPPDPLKMDCWQFVGWADQGALNAHLAQEKLAAQTADQPNLGTYTVWKALVDAVGDGPICRGCYHLGATTVSIAGADCDRSTFLDQLFDAFEAFVDMVSSTFAFIKTQIVGLVVSATGCKALGDTIASACSTLAEAALDAALVSLGIPPSLPNWDQLVEAAKGDIVQLGVDLATQLGVPCDEASFGAEIHGKPELTCEGALEALLDAAEAQIDTLYASTASSMGYAFPAGMRVRPHPSGQVQPASVKITVKPTKYTAAEGGQTCSVGVFPTAWWAGSVDLAATAKLGKYVGGPIVSGLTPGLWPNTMSGPVKIPHLFWSGHAFEKGIWDLPDLKAVGGYAPVSRTYQLYPPADDGPVGVDVLSTYDQPNVTDSQGKPVPGIIHSLQQWPSQVFLLNAKATFSLLVVSGCASGTGTFAWTLPGFGPGPAVKVGG